ncbi:Uncharacterised protein [BD1-7 clade bacterium]|nr:Uncharacterised protein [BD1-7 clade bacterium]
MLELLQKYQVATMGYEHSRCLMNQLNRRIVIRRQFVGGSQPG